MDFIHLVVPAMLHEAEAEAFAEEVIKDDGDGIHGSCGLYDTKPYALWLDTVSRCAAGNPPPHLSAADTFFAIRRLDGAIVGVINIRHRLDSDFMLYYGGHIGYTVRPRERRQGYATQMLCLALGHLRGLAIHRALLTCDPANIASCRTIEACGGIAENEMFYPGTDELVRRYWIDLRAGV